MATIEELDFQLIIDDSQFNKTVSDVKKAAEKLNTQLSTLLSVKAASGGFTAEDLQNMKEMNQLLEQQNKTESKLNNRRKKRVEWEREITAELQKQSATSVPESIHIYEDHSKTINNMRTAQEGFNKEVSKSSKLWMSLKNVTTAYFSIAGASRLISNLVRVTAEFEKQRVSMEAILKDVNGADHLFNQMKELAVMSPFNFKELVTYTKQLSAFSVPMNELYDTTKMLADVSAGLGVGMDRLILAYGQIRSASFLRGQEVRQLTEAGVPILEELRKQFEEMGEIGITAGQVFDKISSRQVTFEMVEKVFKDMTSEGGKFYQMQEVLAETLSGKLSNLKDAYQIMFSEIGEKSNGILVKSVDALRSLAENYEKVGKVMLEVVAAYGVYKTGVLISTIANWIKLGKAANSALPMIKGFTIAMKDNATAMKLLAALKKINPYAALVAGAIAATAAIIHFMKEQNQAFENQKAINKVMEDYNADLENESLKLKFLVQQLDKAEVGTTQYNVAKKKIIDNYGQYLSDLDRENLALGNQVDLYDKLIPALQKAAREKALDTGLDAIGSIYTSTRQGLNKDFDQLIKFIKSDPDLNLPQAVAEELGKYYRSEINYDDFTEEGKQIYNAITKGIKQAGGPFTSAYTNQFTNNYTKALPFDIDKLRENLAQADAILEEGRRDLAESIDVIYGPERPGETAPLKPWQQAIQDIVDEAAKEKIILNLQIGSDSAPDKIINDVKEALEEVTDKAKMYKGIDDQLAESFRKQALYYEKINREVLKGRAAPGGAGSGSSENPRVRQIKDEIDAYKELKNVYEGFAQYLDENGARELTKSFFGRIYGSKAGADYDAEIKRLTDELYALAEAGDEAALSLLGKVASDNAREYQKSMEDAAKTTEEFNEMVDKMKEAFSLEGLSGADLDIAQIAKKYKEAVSKIMDEEEKAKKLLRQQAQNEGWGEDVIESYLEEITNYYAIQTKNALTEASDQAREAIEKFYKELRDKKVDFSHFSDKSVRQLREMKSLIEGLKSTEIDPKTRENLESLGWALDKILASLTELADADIEIIDSEETKQLTTDWGKIARDISSLADAVRELGEASGNVTLSNIGSMLSEMGELAQVVLSAMESGNWVGAFVTVAISAANKVFQAMAKAAQAAAQAREEIRKIVTERYLDTMRDKIEATSTIFGDSFFANVKAVNSAINTLKKDVDKIFSTTGGRGEGSLYSFLQTLSQASGIKLFDDNGIVNNDLLKVLQEAAEGGDFFAAAFMGRYKDQLLNLQDLSEELREMLSTLDETVGEIFSNMGESITDELIDKLWQTGEVVSDLEDVFQGLGDTIMKSLIQSVVIDEVLAKYKDQVMSWFTSEMNADQIAREMDKFAQNVRNDIDAAGGTIKAIFDAFRDYGLISGGESSNDGANALKGLTEETGSLLASYINAIRADVAYNRLQLEDIRGDVRLMLGLLPQAPVLTEYLTQIQANTYNSAERSRLILEHLQDLTTSEGGAAALRVLM